MNEPLEQFVASVPSSGPGVQIPLDLFSVAAPAAPEFKSTRADAPAPGPELANVIQLMPLGAWQQQWQTLHAMVGGMVQARTGYPCDLGSQAQSEGGMIAADAAYALISSNPALAKMILSAESTFFGQLAAVALHGVACVQIVKASAEGKTAPPVDTEKFEAVA